MGLRLLTRTTRNVAPTEAGERLQQSLAPRIAEIEAEIAALTAFRDKPAGAGADHALRPCAEQRRLAEAAAGARATIPTSEVELSIDNGFRNIVEEGFDAGVRLGESVEKDMIAVRIGPDWRLVAVASPVYFATHPAPTHPRDLVGHACINHRQEAAGGLYAWEFEQDGEELRVRVDGQLTFNSSQAMIDAALHGYGIAYVPEDLVARHVAAGELVLVLDDWSPAFAGYYIYYPSRRQTLPAFKVIIDALRHVEA